MESPDEVARRKEEDAMRGPAHENPAEPAEPYLPPEGDPPEPARIPEPWPPPDEGDRPDPERRPPGRKPPEQPGT
jgi:hypothetical protein